MNPADTGPILYAVTPCSLGFVIVASSRRGIRAIELGDDRPSLIASLEARFPDAAVVGAEADAGVRARLDAARMLVEGPGAAPDVPLDPGGTEFQRMVWEALRAIPRGETRTYSQVARSIGRPSASRAVASACGSNRIAIAIPCHRVVRADGALSGYRWGVERKKALLEMERE